MAEQLPVYHTQPPPEWLQEVLQNTCGSTGTDAQVVCLCGRTHVAHDVERHDGPDELQRLRAQSAAQPGTVIWREQTVYASRLYWPGVPDGEYVYGCPCNALTFAEVLIRQNIHLVAATAHAQAERRKREANLLGQCAQSISASASTS